MNTPSALERDMARQPGELAAPAAPPGPCDFCHATIDPDAIYHRLTVGLNADGQTPYEISRHVEEVSEMLICSKCVREVEPVVDRMLEGLWRLRKDDPHSLAAQHLTVTMDEPERSEPAEQAFATPYGLTDATAVAAGAEMLAVAARAYPSSPEGFALGIVVGRLLREGLDASDIHGLVDNIVGARTNRQAEVEA